MASSVPKVSGDLFAEMHRLLAVSEDASQPEVPQTGAAALPSGLITQV